VKLSKTHHFIGGAVTGSIIVLVFGASAWTMSETQSYEDYEKRFSKVTVLLDPKLAKDTMGVMKRVMFAHKRRDARAEVAELGENYTFTQVYEDGPVELASGREIAEQMSVNLYESDYMKNYRGVVAQPIAIVGNIGIQLDVETFEFEDGTQKVTKILTLLETRDGKLWRNWAFYPLGGE